MSFLGKLLILIYGAASLLCLTGAMAVYTQQMGYVTPKGEDPKKVKNRVEQSIARTNSFINANNRAYTRWQQDYEEVIKLEVDMFARRMFYRGQLDLLVSGKLYDNVVQTPIQELEVNSTTGLLDISKPTGRKPVEAKPGLPALTQSYYLAEIKKANGDMVRLQAQTAEKVQQHRNASLVINGQEAPTFVKGLRTRIDEQVAIAKDADIERVFLEDFITNRRAEAQLFVKRRNALQSRVDELLGALKGKSGGQGN